MSKRNPHNTTLLRVKAPAVIDAVMYLDALQASGVSVRITVCVDKWRVSGGTVCEVVAKVKARRVEK